MRRVGLTASGPSAPRGPLVVISCSLSWHVPRGGLSHEDGDWGRAEFRGTAKDRPPASLPGLGRGFHFQPLAPQELGECLSEFFCGCSLFQEAQGTRLLTGRMVRCHRPLKLLWGVSCRQRPTQSCPRACCQCGPRRAGSRLPCCGPGRCGREGRRRPPRSVVLKPRVRVRGWANTRQQRRPRPPAPSHQVPGLSQSPVRGLGAAGGTSRVVIGWLYCSLWGQEDEQVPGESVQSRPERPERRRHGAAPPTLNRIRAAPQAGAAGDTPPTHSLPHPLALTLTHSHRQHFASAAEIV